MPYVTLHQRALQSAEKNMYRLGLLRPTVFGHRDDQFIEKMMRSCFRFA